MDPKLSLLAASLALAAGSAAIAQVNAGQPKDATAVCKDGSFSRSFDRATACRANGGVQEWWGKVVAPKDSPEAEKSPATDPRRPSEVPPAGDKPRGN